MNVPKKKFDFLVFVGRFEPFHVAHQAVLRKALAEAELVIVLVGSSNHSRTIKNPFTYQERANMINASFDDTDESSDRYVIAPLPDQTYNMQKWVTSVQKIVEEQVYMHFGPDTGLKGGIVGHSKDESSFYLKLFPQWEIVDHPMNDVLHATDIRKLYFEKNIKYIRAVVPPGVLESLESFRDTSMYDNLVEEYEFIQKYKKAWEAAPYAPTFVTTDAVVIQSGHILLVKRKAAPGKGLWALPGGFLNQNETIEDGVFRELREETRLKVPLPVLKGSVKATAVFDAPGRSLRGRTITHAFLIELAPGPLPKVKGDDDADEAKWELISHIKEELMYEDHYHIIQKLIGKGSV